MDFKKRIFDIIFIVVSALFLIALIEFNLIEKYLGYALLPIITAYYLGKYSEKRLKN